MAAKTISPRKRSSKGTRTQSYGRQLLSLLDDQRALTKRLADLLERLEDEEDHRIIEAAKKANGNKPLIPWEEAKKRLGLKFD